MSNGMTIDEVKTKFPSIDLAYDVAIQSYELAHKRFESVEGRIQAFLTFVITIELALPVVIHNNIPQTRFNSLWFIFAVVAFVSSVIFGLVARVKWGLQVLDPNKLDKKWLKLPEEQFKAYIIHFAGIHFNINRERIYSKVEYAVIMIILFFVGNALLLGWITNA